MTQLIEDKLLTLLAFRPRIIAFGVFTSAFENHRLICEVGDVTAAAFKLVAHRLLSPYFSVERIDLVDRLVVASVFVAASLRSVFVVRSVLPRRSVWEDSGLRKRTRFATFARPRSSDRYILVRLGISWRLVLNIIQMWLMISWRFIRGLMSRAR